ncbi:hypothetical protein NK213_03320 [Sebaldella sp. S0638]|nr:hypothetical protein [Sebaldella sp. S0638]
MEKRLKTHDYEYSALNKQFIKKV